MKQTNTMPTEGQFVVVYTNNNGIWPDTFMWVNGELRIYDDDEDNFLSSNYNINEQLSNQQNVTYLTI